ncbi:Hypothetical predicted protein [Mytilus galloprovincialis]|nr:Hypothetical predicted protein [Mytilus galloprovincialis]
MRCKFHFDTGIKKTKTHPFLMKSGYKPTFANNAIENYIFATKIELDKIKLKPFKDNLDRTERQGLKSLSSNKDIVIKKADKNASTVILDKQTYINQAMKQLNDNIHYTQLSEANTLGISKTIENKINQLHLKGYVDDKTRNYLNSNKEKQTGRLYLLPKIHKMDIKLKKNIGANKELLKTAEIPGRPIISLCNSPLERIGHLIDYFLKPVVSKLTTYAQDSTSFINKIEKN